MTRRFRCAAIPVLLCASALAPAAAEAKPRVVATLADLWAVTEQLVDGQVDVELATHFGQNPHDFEIRPSQILLVKRADLLIRNGLEEDAWIDPIVESSGNPKLLRGSPNVVEAAQGVQVLKIPRGPIDRSLGDVHPLGNPHFVADPRNLPIVSANIVAGLSRIMPELAATFEANRTAFLAKVGAAYAGWRDRGGPARHPALPPAPRALDPHDEGEAVYGDPPRELVPDRRLGLRRPGDRRQGPDRAPDPGGRAGHEGLLQVDGLPRGQPREGAAVGREGAC